MQGEELKNRKSSLRAGKGKRQVVTYEGVSWRRPLVWQRMNSRLMGFNSHFRPSKDAGFPIGVGGRVSRGVLIRINTLSPETHYIDSGFSKP